MRIFVNYDGVEIELNDAVWQHVMADHAEITLGMLADTLANPDEVWLSRKKANVQLYYLLRRQKRYTCVVVKVCSDGHFVATALTTARIKKGSVIYRKGY